MTTKIKIISGFVLMILLLAVTAFIGYRATEEASTGFTNYQRLARLNTAASDLQKEMYRASDSLRAYMLLRDSASLNTAREALKAVAQQVEAAKTYANLPETQQMIQDVQGGIAAFSNLLEQIVRDLDSAYLFYTTDMRSAAQVLLTQLDSISRAAAQVGSTNALLNAGAVSNAFAAARANATRYGETREPEAAELTKASFASMRKSLEAMSDDLQTQQGRRMMGDLTRAFESYANSFDVLVQKGESVLTGVDKLEKNMTGGFALLVKLNNVCDTAMRSAGSAMRADTDSAQLLMLGVGAVGLAAGIGIALLIVLGLVKVLRQLMAFAAEVSRGNFAFAVKVKEGGEIGATVEAMRAIPGVINRVIEDAKALSGRIMSGRFRDRMDTSAYSGGFADLGSTFNQMGDAYTSVLDNVPVPVMACDKNRMVTFFNKVAQQAVGGNLINEPCNKLLNAEACAANCLGNACMGQNGMVAGETIIRPQGNRMDVAVTAMPLTGPDGQTAGFIEIINDLTEIKEKQNTIIRVANEASGIADRVAAASEEIAAQVEQISRGAEMQRERIETTASAMTEMNSTVLEVARNAGQASEQSDITKQKAEGGSALVSKVVSAIHTVNSVSQTMQKNMEELGVQAESIGSVMSVISDIADQTNLLALNAAIEAARAGEAGRGFAVVADEVRKLAEKTMSATQEVGSNITSIQESTRKSIHEMENAARGVAEATELANESGTALTEIVDLASANSSVVTSIAAAAEEQSATSEEINRAIEEINQVVGETTEGMVQSSAAVQDLSRMAQELRRTMESLN